METGNAWTGLKDVSYAYEKRPILQHVDFTLGKGEMTALVGESGSGKTTLLKILAGKSRVKKGRVMLAGNRRDRKILSKWGCIFSDSLLIEWLKIGVQFSLLLRRHGIRGDAAEARMMKALFLVEMSGWEDLFPGQLSTGEYQRVLLAQAMLLRPRLMILDDPLCRVEAAQRKRIWKRLKDWQEEHDISILYATAQPEEALRDADRIILLRDGAIVQEGTPDQLLHETESHYAASFLRHCNILRGQITGFGKKTAALEMDGIILPCLPHPGAALHDRVALCVDWEEVHFGMRPQGRIFLSGVLREYTRGPGGEMAVMELPGGGQMLAYCHQGEDCPAGSRVFLWWNMERASVMLWDNSVK